MTQQVSAHHLSRLAYLYVRQSTLQQVLENTESTARQYALRERALALGWSQERIVVIDQDLGHWGASTADRLGGSRLVAEVGLGQVGLVLGLEVSRLARNSSDWHQLLEMCALTRTLILDEEGLSDPATFNDRLLLGLKGTMSEAELFVLRARLQGGILNKARRGALKLILPIGFVYTETDAVVLDPDLQVQASIREVFRRFAHTGSAFTTVRHFRQQHLLFPRRLRRGAHQGELAWAEIEHHDVLRLLHHPAYAGASVYGRSRTTKTADGKLHIQDVPRADWVALVREAHVGYISWEDFERERVTACFERSSLCSQAFFPATGGARALAGFDPLWLLWRADDGALSPAQRAAHHPRLPVSESKHCPGEYSLSTHSWARRRPRAIGAVLLERMTPQTLALTLAVQEEVIQRADEARRLRHLQVERAQYEAELAQRRYLKVDPNNRLVASVLEAEWNAKLVALEEARAVEERYNQGDQQQVSVEERADIEQVPDRFRRFCPRVAQRDVTSSKLT